MQSNILLCSATIYLSVVSIFQYAAQQNMQSSSEHTQYTSLRYLYNYIIFFYIKQFIALFTVIVKCYCQCGLQKNEYEGYYEVLTK